MTESQERKIQNLLIEIEKTETKINKLLTHRAMLADQIKKIRSRPPKEVVKPSDEQRKAQSEKDKAEFAARSQKFSTSIRKLDLFS
jgi:chorismate mutase